MKAKTAARILAGLAAVLSVGAALAHPGHGAAAGHFHGPETLVVALIGGVLGLLLTRR